MKNLIPTWMIGYIMLQASNGLCQLPSSTVYDSILQQDLVHRVPGGVVLITINGQTHYQKAFGTADLELQITMQPHHIFRIGSITKQFTAVAILKLVEEGRLSLNNKLQKFIEDVPSHCKMITIRQLLNHTSGIRNITDQPNWSITMQRGDMSIEDLIKLFLKEPLYFTPGTDFHYSNSNYILLARIIELVTGKDYEDFVHETILDPLELHSASYDHTEKVISNRIPGYDKLDYHFGHARYINMDLPSGAGGLIMSVNDFFRWNQALKNGLVINDSLLRQAQSPTLLSNGRQMGYGFGWAIGQLQGYQTVKHAGFINGFSVFEVYVPEKDILAVLATNCSNVWELETIISRMISMTMNKPFKNESITLKRHELKKFVGVYQNDYGDKRKIFLQGDELFFSPPGSGKTLLVPTSASSFLLSGTLTALNFSNPIQFVLHDLDMPQEFRQVNSDENLIFSLQPLSEKRAHDYIGSYQFVDGPIFEITYEDGNLFGAVGQDKKQLTRYAEDFFFVPDMDAQILFQRNQQHDVITLKKIQNGEMVAKRIP